MKRLPLLAVVALVLAVGVAACSGGSPAEPEPSPSVTGAGAREVQAGAPIGDPTSGPPTHEAKVVYAGRKDRPAVALTFDTGVDAAHMPEVLDALKKYGVSATFGITGQWAAANPALLKRIVKEGHVVINHSWSHSSFTGEDTHTPPLSDDAIRGELKRTEEKIQQIAGVSTKPYFRPPYGDYDSRVDRIAFEEGYEYNVLWYLDGLGWEGRPTKYVVDATLANAFNGAIFLYHIDNPYEYAALEEIILGLQERGLQMVTVPQLLSQQPLPTPGPFPTATPKPARPAPGRTPHPAPPPVSSPVPYAIFASDNFESASTGGGRGWAEAWSGPAFVVADGEAHSGVRYLDMAAIGSLTRSAAVSPQGRPRLRFWARFRSIAAGDSATLRVSSGGGTWAAYQLPAIADADGAWRRYEFNLPVASASQRVWIQFVSQMDPAVGAWDIDDVNLVGILP